MTFDKVVNFKNAVTFLPSVYHSMDKEFRFIASPTH